MKTRQRRAGILGTTLALSIQFSAQAADEVGQLIVYSDVIGAQALLAGDYAQALKLMGNNKRENSIFLENNLCVAYILGNNFARARQRCNAALDAAERSSNYGEWLERTKSTRVRRVYRERALRHLSVLDGLNPKRLVRARP
ncbi:MAG: hypothetical protein AAF542_09020 [Pseudomonadota bacterium]